MVAIPSETLSIALDLEKGTNNKNRLSKRVLLFTFICTSLIFFFRLTPSPHYCIKETHHNFVGREEIFKEILEEWKNHKNHPAKILLFGKTGIGKTEAAIAFANRFRNRFKLTYFFNCETEEMLYENFIHLSQELEIPLIENEPLNQFANRIYSHLEKKKLPWLFIYDNAWKLLPLPDKGRGICLVTSRNGSFLSSAHKIQVPPFTHEESQELIQRILPEKAQASWSPLIEKWEGLPIMLAESLQYLKRAKICDVEDYLKLIEKMEDAVLAAHPDDDRYGKNYASAFKIAFRQMEHSMPLAASFLEAASHLHPDGIPKNWIESHLLANQLADASKAPIIANEIASYLINRGILRYNELTRVFSIHRLIQNLIRSLEEVDHRGLCSALKLLTLPFSNTYTPFYFESLFESKNHLSDWAINALWFAEHSAVEGREEWISLKSKKNEIFSSLNLELQESWINLLWGIGEHFTSWKDNYKVGKAYFQEAMELFTLSGSQNLILESRIASDYAYNLACMNAYKEALPYYKLALSNSKKLNDPFLIARYLCQYGWGYLSTDLAKCKQYMEKAEDALSSLPNQLLVEKAAILKNKGMIALREDRLEDARAFLTKALKTNDKIFDDKTNTQRLLILRELGKLGLQSGLFNQAIDYLTMASDLSIVAYNTPFSLLNAGVRIRLCKAYFRMGSFKKAIKIGQEVIEIVEKLFPEKAHDFHLMQLMLLIDLFEELGKKQQLKLHYEKFLTVIHRTTHIRISLWSEANTKLAKYEAYYGKSDRVESCKEHLRKMAAEDF